MKRSIKTFFKKKYRRIFELGQKLGINILPRHFYSNIPDMQQLRHDKAWLKPLSMTNIEMNNTVEQMLLLHAICEVENMELLTAKDIYKKAVKENGEDGGFGLVESEFLHCFIKYYRPEKVIQVGCGVSTSVMLNAAKEINHEIKMTCIEPYPTAFLIKKSASKEISLLAKKAQETEIEMYSQLKAGDLLFIDSTHTVKPGSEVNFLVFEILPRLSKGVYVHFHDIYFPYDYGRNILGTDLFFWLENSLLYAFLIGNKKFKIIISHSMLHYEKNEELKALFTGYNPQENYFGTAKGETSRKHFPASLYLQVME
jgi:hypothetical protein